MTSSNYSILSWDTADEINSYFLWDALKSICMYIFSRVWFFIDFLHIYKIGPLIYSNPHNTCFVLYRFGSINIAYFFPGTIKIDLLKAFDLMYSHLELFINFSKLRYSIQESKLTFPKILNFWAQQVIENALNHCKMKIYFHVIMICEIIFCVITHISYHSVTFCCCF